MKYFVLMNRNRYVGPFTQMELFKYLESATGFTDIYEALRCLGNAKIVQQVNLLDLETTYKHSLLAERIEQ